MSLVHETPLISTLAIGLSAAFVGGLIATRLRLSPIVGYLVAGIAIGPFTPGLVANASIAQELSEIGIVLLMFGVGLHFSLKDLMAVRAIALPGAIAQIAAATAMGTLAGVLWGWQIHSGLLLGLALSVASTVVLLRALEDNHAVQSINGRIAIGWLIVEDIAMVLALVLIPAVMPSFNGPGDAMPPVSEWLPSLFSALGKISLFVIFMLVAGKRALPALLSIVAHSGSRELFTLSVFTVAVGIAFGAAALFGVSFALGAFFAGMMIKESDLSAQVAEKALPFQDAFAVLFFVSVGMLFNPMILVESPLRVLVVVAIIILGKSIAAFALVLLFRYPIRTALMVSIGLAQIGEFSFILATLGLKYEIFPQEAHSLILAGALISITLNPFIFHAIGPIQAFFSRRLYFSRRFAVPEDDLAHLTPSEKKSLVTPIVLVGFGRVGKHIEESLIEANMDLVAIDLNRSRVEDMRSRGLKAIAGDATLESTLREAMIHKASAIIVAVPNPFEARRIVESARALKPSIDVLVRAQTREEYAYFRQQNVNLPVLETQEVARRMVEFLHKRLPDIDERARQLPLNIPERTPTDAPPPPSIFRR